MKILSISSFAVQLEFESNISISRVCIFEGFNSSEEEEGCARQEARCRPPGQMGSVACHWLRSTYGQISVNAFRWPSSPPWFRYSAEEQHTGETWAVKLDDASNATFERLLENSSSPLIEPTVGSNPGKNRNDRVEFLLPPLVGLVIGSTRLEVGYFGIFSGERNWKEGSESME